MGANWRVKETLCCFECRNYSEERFGNVLFFSVTLLKPLGFLCRARHTSTGSGLVPPIQLAHSLTCSMLTVLCKMKDMNLIFFSLIWLSVGCRSFTHLPVHPCKVQNNTTLLFSAKTRNNPIIFAPRDVKFLLFWLKTW